VRAEWWALISHPVECRRCKGGQTSSGIHPVSRMIRRARLVALRQIFDRFAAPAEVSPLVERKLKVGCEEKWAVVSHPFECRRRNLEGQSAAAPAPIKAVLCVKDLIARR
jgi:hypothetical protein